MEPIKMSANSYYQQRRNDPHSRNTPASAKPKPHCPDCNGQGWYSYNVDNHHPLFGRLFPCQTCNGEVLFNRSGLTHAERNTSLEGMVIDNRPGTVGMIQAAKTFIGDPRGFLTIHGSFGTGKSTALKSIVAECVKFGIEAHYTTLSEIMAYAREAFRDPNDTDYGRITRLARIQVLAIDEVDKARLTEYAREIQTHFFDVRYRNAGILGTVLAWNGSFEALDMPWVRSRLTEYPIISNNDADARPMIGGGK